MKNDSKVNILGVMIDKISIADAVECIVKMLESHHTNTVFTPNSEIILTAYKDKEFCDILNSADMLTADGIGVVYASKILGNPIEERAAGYDIACGVLDRISETGHRLYLLGGKPGTAEKAKRNLERKYPFIQIVGTHDGYFSDEQVDEIVSDINRLNSDIVFVCLGAPKQEKFMHGHREELDVRLMIGLGGSLDGFAGTVRRAPKWMIRLQLEWLYRLIKEPRRIGRMMRLPKFVLAVLARRLRGGKAHG